MAPGMVWKLVFSTVLVAAAPLCSAPAQAQSSTAPVQTLRIVGGLAGLNQYTRSEEPFWSKEVSRLSQGKYTAEIVPFDRAGVPGAELLRLMQLGVVPFGTALLSHIAAQNPDLAAPDLAGLNADIASLKRNVAAFRPYLQQTLRERHGIELLAVYTYPAQLVFCNKPLRSIADLATRTVRVSSPTQSDFVAALGGRPVLLSFDQMMNGMKTGATECAITGAMSGNTVGLHEITSHIHALPVTWGIALFGANRTAWLALPGDLRALLANEIPKLETTIWAESERETSEGLACNQGQSSCKAGRKGRMEVASVTAQDEARRKELLTSTVLPRWLKRCNRRCADLWNRTLGPVNAITLTEGP